ncbi:HAMP domain-containing histidine kinase [Patescibacteria group bacterium]|nr:HAMP domain-containing histidine kinase [Patescibacteria group bacterium]
MAKETLDIVKEYGTVFIQMVISLIGVGAVQASLKNEFPQGEISVNEAGDIEIRSDGAKKNIKKTISYFAERMVKNFGYDFSENALRRIYGNLKNKYRDEIYIREILDIIPEGFLEKEKVGYLSKGELEKRVLERTKELRELNIGLEKTVLERTKELIAANDQLEKKNKELEHLSQAKTEFLSLVSHQMLTPLSAIRWSLTTLQESIGIARLRKEDKRLFDNLLISNERMSRLIINLLNIARIEEGRFLYRFVKIPIIDVVSEVIEALSPLSRKKSITVKFKKPSLNALVMADKEKLSLAVENILDNAIKYTPVKKNIEAGITFKDTRAVIYIKDEGAGIPKEDQGKIFTRFFRAKNVQGGEASGSGLGLFLAKKIIVDHGGEVRFESKVGKGTTFFVELPVVK